MTLAVVTAPPKPGRTKPPAQPFTLPHWRAWTSDLILDTGESWHPEDFQDAFVDDVFSGVPEIWFVVPEGNTKTTTLAGLALYHAEFRQYASVPVAASSREQAEILYRQAEGFVLRSPRLHRPMHSAIQEAKGKRKTEIPRFTCLEGYRRINHVNGGRIQIFAADDRTGDGQIPTLGLLEELHRHRDLALYRTWVGKIAKRQGQIAAISTRGEPGSEFEETLERIRRQAETVVRRGSFTRASSSRIILHEWAVPDKADVTDMPTVKAANPFSGVTVDGLREKFKSPTMTMEYWLRFVCGRPARGFNSAIAESEWTAAGKDYEPIPEDQPIWLGLDLAWKWDTTAAVPFWPRDREYRVFGKPEILTPPRDGTLLDPELVMAAILRIHQRNPIHTVAMDMHGGAEIASWMESELGATVIDRAQSNHWAAIDFERFMEAIRYGWFHQPGDPAFTKQVLNAVAKGLLDGRTRFERPAQSRQSAEQERRVIDALTAAAMVNSAAAADFERPKPSPGPAFVSY